MKTTTVLKSVLLITLISTITFSCKKKKDEEPFSDKFKMTMQWRNLFDNIDNQDGGNTITVPSGSNLIFFSEVGGKEGLGKLTITSFEITREKASGTSTSKFLPSNRGTNSLMEPVYENTKYTFTIKASDGSVATQGPFIVNVNTDSKTIIASPRGSFGNSALRVYGNGYKEIYSTTYRTQGLEHLYDVAFEGDIVNPHFFDFGLIKDASNNLFLLSPSLFDSLNLMPEFNEYRNSFRHTRFEAYTGTIDLLNLSNTNALNTLTFNSLQNDLNITSNSGKIQVQDGAQFMFKTAEGKKGIGRFKNVVAGVSTELILVFQR